MNTLIYWFARAFIGLIQFLPLHFVARLGRFFGALAWKLDATRRRLALDNLTQVFRAEKSADEIQKIARETFLRIGENMICSVKTAAMSFKELQPHLEIGSENPLPQKKTGEPLPNFVFAIGHFGNFELYARLADLLPGYQLATTYRALKQPALNRLMQEMRNRSGAIFFERRTDGPLLRAKFHEGGLILGLLGDQHSQGINAPFLGRDAHTGIAPAVFALRYDCELYTAFCFRTGLAKWRMELGDKIATHENGKARTSEAIMRDVNLSYEKAIRRDPANWFCWVHRRWKKK